MRGLFSITAILWLFNLVTYVHAANWNAHVYERIWLWEMYDYFCDVKGGADKQGMIFAQKKGGWVPFRNVGTGFNGKLTYAEFQTRLQGKGLLEINIPTDMPDENQNSIHDLAKDLLKRGWNGILDVPAIDDSFGKKWTPPKTDPHQEQYHALIDKIEKQYSKFRLDHDVDGAKARRIAGLGEAIVNLRKEDSQNWISEYFKKDPSRGGLGLSDIVLEQRDSRVPGGPKYQQVNIGATFTAYTNADGTLRPPLVNSFRDQQAMIDWIDKQGDPNSGINFSDSSKSHWRAMKSWKNAWTWNMLTPATLKTCRG